MSTTTVERTEPEALVEVIELPVCEGLICPMTGTGTCTTDKGQQGQCSAC